MGIVKIVGLGLGRNSINREVEEAVCKAEFLAGSPRHLALFQNYKGKTLARGKLMKPWLETIVRQAKTLNGVVLVSGDPGYFGIAAKLLPKLGKENVEIIPNLSAFQAAFARLKLSWVNSQVVCLHGRHIENFYPALLFSNKIALLTDHVNTPAKVAEMLLQREQDNFEVWVLEELGSKKEKISSWALEKLVKRKFAPLSMMVLLRSKKVKPLPKIKDHLGTLFTLLNLEPGDIYWEVDVDKNSLFPNACRLLWQGNAFAVSKKQNQIKELEKIRRDFSLANLDIRKNPTKEQIKELSCPGKIHLGSTGDDPLKKLSFYLDCLDEKGVLLFSTGNLNDFRKCYELLRKSNRLLDAGMIENSGFSQGLTGLEFKKINSLYYLTASAEK